MKKTLVICFTAFIGVSLFMSTLQSVQANYVSCQDGTTACCTYTNCGCTCDDQLCNPFTGECRSTGIWTCDACTGCSGTGDPACGGGGGGGVTPQPTSTPEPTNTPPPTPTDPPDQLCPDGSSPPCFTCGTWSCTTQIYGLPGTGACVGTDKCPGKKDCSWSGDCTGTHEDGCITCDDFSYSPLWVQVVSVEGGNLIAWKGLKTNDPISGTNWSISPASGGGLAADGYFQNYNAYYEPSVKTFSRTTNRISASMNLDVLSTHLNGEQWSNHFCARGKAQRDTGSWFPPTTTTHCGIGNRYCQITDCATAEYCTVDHDGCIYPLVGGEACAAGDDDCWNAGSFWALNAIMARMRTSESLLGHRYEGAWTMSTWGLRKIEGWVQEAKVRLTVPDGYRCKNIYIVTAKYDTQSGVMDTNRTSGEGRAIEDNRCQVEFNMNEVGNFLVFEIEPEGTGSVCADLHYATITSPADGSSFTRSQNISFVGQVQDWSSTANPGAYEVHVYKGAQFIASIPVNSSNGLFSGQIPAYLLSGSGGTETVQVNLFAILNDGTVCGNWPINLNPINVTINNSTPTTGDFSILNSSGGVVCTNSGCNGRDVIEAVTQTTSTQLRVRARFTDNDTPATGSNMLTDIRNAYIIFDNNNDGNDGWFYRINYLDNGGVQSITEDATSSYASKLSISGWSVTTNGGVIDVEATISLSSLDYSGSLGPFFSNVYLNAIDYGGVSSGRSLKTGDETGWSTVSQSGNYPWQANGIGASWTNEASAFTRYCSGNSCWTYDRNLNKFSDGGKPFSMSSVYSAISPVSGTYPWTNGGPTSAWENRSTGTNYICNMGYCWSYIGSSWSSITLATASGWSSMPAYYFRFIWSNGGPKAAWNNPLNNEMNVCNGDYCWKIDSSNISLISNFRPSETWSLSSYSLSGQNIYPWTNDGPTTAWTSYYANLIYICNGPICWTYNPSAGTWSAPYTIPSQAAGLDIWNGKGVSLWASQVSAGNYVVSNPQVAWSVPAGCSWTDGTTPALSDSGSGTITLPYTHYGGTNACLYTTQGGIKGYYLTGMSIPWQGSATAATAGSYTTSLIRGGASHNLLPSDFVFTDNSPTLPADSLSIYGSTGGGSPSCTGSACNGIDVIGQLDSTTGGGYDQKILFTMRIKDPETLSMVNAPPPAQKRSDVKTAVFSIRDGATTVASLTYTDTENNSFSTSQTGNTTYLTSSSPFTSITSSRSGDTLIVNFVFDMATIRADRSFEGDLFLSAADFAGATTGAATEVASNLPFWDGSSVLVRFAHNNIGGFIPTSPTLLITYPADCLASGSQTTVTLPATAGGSTTGVYTLPYAHASGSNSCPLTIRSSSNGYYVMSVDMSNVGGSNILASQGTVTTAYIAATGYGGATYTIPVTLQDTAPSNTSVTVFGNSSGVGGSSCTNASCSTVDIIEDLDSDRDKIVRITASVTDPENASPFPATVPPSNKSGDIASMVITVRDSVANTTVLQVTYTDPTSSASPATTTTTTFNSSYFVAGATVSDIVTTLSPSVSGNVLSVPFTVNLSKLLNTKSFRGSITVQSTDFAGATTGTVTPIQQLDIWNGRAISVVFRHARTGNYTPSGTIQLRVTDVNSCLSQIYPGNPAYSSNQYTVTLGAIGSDSTAITLPYYLALPAAGGTCPVTITSLKNGYYLTTLNMLDVGGANPTTCTNGTCNGLQVSIGDVTDTNRIIPATMRDTSPVFTGISGGAFSIQNAKTEGVVGGSCADTDCNNVDLITDLFSGDFSGSSSDQKFDKIVRFSIRVNDDENAFSSYIPPSSKHSDLSQFKVSVVDSNTFTEMFYIDYRSPVNPDNPDHYLITKDYDRDVFESNPIPDVPTVALSGNVLRISFNVHLDTMKKNRAFLGRVDLSAVDQAGSSVERVNYVSGLDFWNGQDINIQGAYREMKALYTPAGVEDCPPLSGNISDPLVSDEAHITASYSIDAGEWNYDGNTPPPGTSQDDLLWYKDDIYQPYVYYSKSAEGLVTSPYITFGPSPNSTFYLYAGNFEAYGTQCQFAEGDGTIGPLQFNEGGYTIPGPRATIFIVRVGNAWIQNMGSGNIFSFSPLAMDIPFTCINSDVECYVSRPLEGSIENNGMIITNGLLSGSITSANRYGTPFNWYTSSIGTQARPANKSTVEAMMNFPTYGWLTNFLDNAGLTNSGLLVKRTLASETTIGGSVNTESNTIYLFEPEILPPTVRVTENVDVPDGFFQVYIIRGDLEIEQDVTKMEGIYIVDGNITIYDEGVENLQPLPNATEEQLEALGQLKITGTMVARGQVNILRSLGAANNYHPPVIFEYDIAMMHNFIDDPIVSSYFPLYTNAQGEE